jgi:hypothetical protein
MPAIRNSADFREILPALMMFFGGERKVRRRGRPLSPGWKSTGSTDACIHLEV